MLSRADLSAEHNQPVDLPLTNETLAGIADMIKARRAPLT
jgi:hypothetical protein